MTSGRRVNPLETPDEKRLRHNAYTRAATARNPQRVAAYNRKWKAAHPDYHRDWRLQRYYGLTSEMFDEYLDAQEGMCGLCDRPLPNKKSAIAVDHDHETGQFRALLHVRCNAWLGVMETDDRFIGYMAAHAPALLRESPVAEANCG